MLRSPWGVQFDMIPACPRFFDRDFQHFGNFIVIDFERFQAQVVFH